MTIDDVRSTRERTVPLPWLLRRVNQRYRSEAAAQLADAGLADLPQPGYWALMALARGADGAAQLVAEMGVSKQAVSKLVDNLASGGFIERKPNHADRRRTELALTPRGREAVEVIASSVQETERRMVAKLGEEPFAELTRVLHELATEEV